ncbi:MAG: methyl-accepting chemotaxis protein [Pseudomonas sp.]
MRHLSVRIKLYLLVFCAVGALVLVGLCGWLGVRQVGGALHAISDRSLPAVSALTQLRASRLEAARAMQDGVGFRPEQYANMYDKSPMIEEAKAIFTDALTQARDSNQVAERAFEVYERLPKTSEEVALWDNIKQIWNSNRHIDDQQLALTEALTTVEDWASLERDFMMFASSTRDWSYVANQLSPMLAKLSEINIAAAEASREAADRSIASARTITLTILAIAVAVVTVLGIFIARGVIASLHEIRSTVSRVAESNDFTLRAAVQGNDEAAQAAMAFNHLLAFIQQSLSEVTASTETVGDAAERALAVSRQVAESASVQSEAATAMATAIEQMTVSIGHITGSSRDVQERSREARTAANVGAEIVGRTAREMEQVAHEIALAGEAVGALGRESQSISGILKVIKEVAEQTNLLALNAAIEAARAGDQGRGFAVVADEVRRLSERTSASTHDIGQMVEAMQASARSAVGTVGAVVGRAQGARGMSEETARRIDEICDNTSRVANSVAEVSASLTEQDRAAQDISRRVEAIAHMSEENCVAGGRTADVAQDLDEAAQALRTIVGRFTI